MRKLYLLVLLTVSLSLCYAQRQPAAVNDVATVYENGTVLINVLANDSNFNAPDSVCVTSLWGGAAGWPVVQGCTQVLFHPLNATFVGLDTFYYQACDRVQPTLCDTGRVIVTVLIRAPKALNDTVTVLEGDTLAINVLANDSNFNAPDSIRINNIYGQPTGWAYVHDSAQVIVTSLIANYYGVYSFFYRSCDRQIPTLCDTGIVAVNVIRKPIAYPDSGMVVQPDTTVINVTANDSDLNVLDSACVTAIWGLPAGWASIQGCSQIQFDPANIDFAGNDTFYYKSCYSQTPTVCDTARVIVTVILPKPLVDFTWYEDSPCVAQVYNNSILADSVVWAVQYLTTNGTNDTIYGVNEIQVMSNMVDSGFEAQVCLTGYNPSGDSTVCYNFWIQCSLINRIAAVASSSLRVYPNPAYDKIQIDLSGVDATIRNDLSTVVIYDLMGKALQTMAVADIGNAIPVNNLSPGMYLIGLADKSSNKRMLGKFDIIR